jgi:hypothetical protein
MPKLPTRSRLAIQISLPFVRPDKPPPGPPLPQDVQQRALAAITHLLLQVILPPERKEARDDARR